MATENDIRIDFEMIWVIQNFNFCWHKTGEFLESPLFRMSFYLDTSWRLCIYPRGEDDGEHVSCYLFRDKGGPEIVKVDFELFLDVGDVGQFKVKPPETFSKIYSFKILQKEGLRRFASRKEIFVPIASQKEKLTLFFGCRIFNADSRAICLVRHFGCTTIATDRISGTEVFDIPTDLKPDNCADMDVRSPLEKDPLMGISLSCCEESIVIKVYPKSCHKIKYATCKITLINQWTNESPIEYVRCWIGKIQSQIWRYKVPCQDSEQMKPGFEITPSKVLIFHYDFTFSTGDQVVCDISTNYCEDWKTLIFTLSEYLDMKMITTKPIPTALKALQSLWESASFTDCDIDMLDGFYPVHKAFLCARVPIFKSFLENISGNLIIRDLFSYVFEDFLLFLYTDSLPESFFDIKFHISFLEVVELFNFSLLFKIESLKTKCRLYLTENLHFETAADVLELAVNCRDSSLKAIAESYIITHYDLVCKTKTWLQLLKEDEKLVGKIHLLKYTKKKTMH